jgi:hypothetical protein
MQANEIHTQRATHRMLIVADRGADPIALIDALREQVAHERIEATVLVPASLHGLEWVGDPRATIPAAERHAALLQAALLNLGVARCEARVGDPDPHAAIDDALRTESFDEVLINVRSPRLANVFHVGLADRIETGRDTDVRDLRPGALPRSRKNPLVAETA